MAQPSNNRARRRPGKSTFTTKSGKTLKLHQSLTERWKANKEAKSRRRATELAKMPKNKFKRLLYRLHPKRLAAYWFSREGALMALKITGIAIVVGFFLIVGLFAFFRKDLPNITDLSGTIGATVSYYDRTGQTLLYEDSEALKRVPVSGDNISQFMKDATIAIEDKEFYEHGAFDFRGIVRAGFNDIFNRSGGLQGGSTITQQLVKLNQDWTHDRTIARKIKELILAVELEREYSKDDILNGYLNIAPYGGILYGAETAARDYFGTTAKDLTLAQAALLAAIPQSPTFYSPYLAKEDQESREALIGRQHYVLDQMADQGKITKEQAEEAKAVDILAQVQPRPANKYQGIRAPYFVLAAREELISKYGKDTVIRGGWKVTTTMDLRLQDIAEEQVSKGLAQVRTQIPNNVSGRACVDAHGQACKDGANIAFAAIDVETAQMVALVGGADFNNPYFGQINYAQHELPPGSSFKMYDYVAMIENTTNAGAGSVLYDDKAPLPGYPCTNQNLPRNGGNCLHDYDFRFPGPLSIRYALAGSRNVPAVKAMLSVVPGNNTASINKTIETAEKMGLIGKKDESTGEYKGGYKCYEDEALTSETQCFASSAIGDGAYLSLDQHVNGYATMARLGTYLPQTYILKVTDDKGKVIDEWKQPKGEQVVRPDSAYIVADILRDPNASYMTQKIHDYNGWDFAIKTGTTNDAKDGWMMGTSTKYAAGVWVGHYSRQVEMTGFMENMTRPIWRGWMTGAHDGLQAKNWTPPSGVKTLAAFVVSQGLGTGARVPSPNQDIFPSWYKAPSASEGGSQIFDKVSNKLATSCTPDLAREERTGGNAASFSADIFHGTANNTTDTDDVHNCNDVPPFIDLTAPTTCSNAVNCEFTVTIDRGTHAINSDAFPGAVNLIINGQLVESRAITTTPNTITFHYAPTAAGTATVQVQVVDSVLYSSTKQATVVFNP